MTSTGYPTKVAYRLLRSNRVIKQICDELNSLKTNNDLKWFEDDIVVTKAHIPGGAIRRDNFSEKVFCQ